MLFVWKRIIVFEFIILDYIYDNYNKIYSIKNKLSKILTDSLSSVVSYDNSFYIKWTRT
jgi:hypothetical protein